MPFDRNLLHVPRRFFSALNIVRVPLAVAVLASLALSVPPQTREIYRVLAQDLQTDWPQILASYVSLCLAAWVLWSTARHLTRLRTGDRGPERVNAFMRTWLPRFIGAAPIVACGIGILYARQGLIYAAVHAGDVLAVLGGDSRIAELEALKAQLETHSEILQIGAAICFGLAAALLVVWSRLPAQSESAQRLSPLRSLFGTERRLVFYALAVAAAITFSLMLVEVPQALGALAIFNVFVICLALILTLLDVAGRRYGIPFITILAIVAVVASVFELNNNHRIRTWRTSEPFEKPHVLRAFDAWYNAREDRKFYEDLNRPYPVYIVAARGGGLYAAYHTAKFLARLQDRCPNFAQHTFAISGVSGGSVGGAVFAALTKALEAPNNGHVPCAALNQTTNQTYEKRVDTFFDADFLSPLLAALLFPDFMQHFLPYPIPRFDRARALEASFEKTWAELAPEDPGIFAGDVFTLWDADGSTPALILNTTNVETGINHAVMPFTRMDETRVPLFDVLHPTSEAPVDLGEDKPNMRYRETMALSTAVVLSARFPWVLPAGSYDALSFVDGGYYDNSGLSAAEDIIAILRERYPDVEFIVISFFDWIEFGERFTELYEDRPVRIDATAPISTMLSVRETRVGDTFLRLAGRPDYPGFENAPEGGEVKPARLVALDASDWHLPLVWHLSRLTRNLVGVYSGAPSACRLDGSNRDEPDADLVQLSFTDCTSCRVHHELSGHRRADPGGEAYRCAAPGNGPP